MTKENDFGQMPNELFESLKRTGDQIRVLDEGRKGEPETIVRYCNEEGGCLRIMGGDGNWYQITNEWAASFRMRYNIRRRLVGGDNLKR